MSDINFISINENFPVAGQDNDTQVFRDNFDSIKTALNVAKTEITDLENNTARTDQSTDFNYNILTSVTLQDAYVRIKDYGSPISAGTQEVSFKQALYHIIKFSNNCALSFIEFPTTELNEDRLGQLGKATLELYGDGAAAISAGSFVPGTSYQIVVLGSTTNTQWNTIAGTSSVTYSVGSIFTAAIAGTGLGNGTARIARNISFTTIGTTNLKKSSNFPATLSVASATNPVIIEVWQYSTDAIYLNYLGNFS